MTSMTPACLRERVYSQMAGLRRKHEEVNSLIIELERLGPTAVVGGATRDWWVGREPRDIDLIVETEETPLDSLLGPRASRRTRYGGYSLLVDGVRFDIWALKATWPFKSGIIKEVSLEQFTRVVFFNIDSGAVSLSDGRTYEHGLFECLTTRVLQTVYPDNPHPDVCAARALALAKNYRLRLGASIIEYLSRRLEHGLRWPAIESAQWAHYGRLVVYESEASHILPALVQDRLLGTDSIKQRHRPL